MPQQLSEIIEEDRLKILSPFLIWATPWLHALSDVESTQFGATACRA